MSFNFLFSFKIDEGYWTILKDICFINSNYSAGHFINTKTKHILCFFPYSCIFYDEYKTAETVVYTIIILLLLFLLTYSKQCCSVYHVDFFSRKFIHNDIFMNWILNTLTNFLWNVLAVKKNLIASMNED